MADRNSIPLYALGTGEALSYSPVMADDDTWNSVPLAALGTGMLPAPPYSPPIGFEDMSPHERAAYRVRGGPPAQPPPQATPEEMRDAALTLASTNPILRG